MSVFETLFKVKDESAETEMINLLAKVTNNKMTKSEIERVYRKLDTEVIKKLPRNIQIIEAMGMLSSLKGDWLTTDEKENFVAGVWMLDTLDTTKKKNKAYINEVQLKYVKQAVLGEQFKAARSGEYFENLKEYMYKY